MASNRRGFDDQATLARVRLRHGSSVAVPRRSRGQLLSCAALILALLMSALVGLGVYLPLNTLDIGSLSSVTRASSWLTLLVVGLVGLVATLVLAIVALFVARPRLVATIATVLTLVLPVVSAVIAAKFGAVAFVRHTAAGAGQAATAVAHAIAVRLGAPGLDVGVLAHLIRWIFG